MRGSRSNPWRWLTEQRVTYALKILMVVVLGLYIAEFALNVLVQLRGVVYVLITAIFLAYLIYPAIVWLRRRIGLVAAIVVVYAVIVGAIIVAVFIVAPHVVDEANTLVKRYPELVARLHAMVYDSRNPLTSRLPIWAQHGIANIPSDFALWAQSIAVHSFGHIVVVLAGTAAIVAIFVIVPMVTAYLLLDLDNLKASLAAVVPEERWRTTLGLLADIDRVIGGFIRGQLLVALFVGVLITLAMMVLRVPYPFLFGLLAALGDLVPYVGALLAYLPAVLSAVLSNGWINALLVTAAFVIIYETEGHLIAPTIVGKQVRLSPFVVIVSLLIGAEVAGIFGMLVAVPIAGVLRVVALRLLRAAKAS